MSNKNDKKTNQEILAHLKEHFKKYNVYRRSGRTTADCLEIIAKALKNPKKEIGLYDHSMLDMDKSDKNLENLFIKKITIPRLKEVINDLQLDRLYINEEDNFLIYDFQTPEDWEYRLKLEEK